MLTASQAWRLLELLRWDGREPDCPHCGAAGTGYPLAPPADATTPRRVWKCRRCRRQFSVLTGTVLEGSRIDVRFWLAEIDRAETGDRPPTASSAGRPSASPAAARHVRRIVAAALEVTGPQRPNPRSSSPRRD